MGFWSSVDVKKAGLLRRATTTNNVSKVGEIIERDVRYSVRHAA